VKFVKVLTVHSVPVWINVGLIATLREVDGKRHIRMNNGDVIITATTMDDLMERIGWAPQ